MEQEHYPIVIIGAGLCGLSAAYHLEQLGCSDYILLEKQSKVGGLIATEEDGGFHFDRAPHFLFSMDPYVVDLVCNAFLPKNVKKFSREAYCYAEGKYIKFPYQAHNYGLPYPVIFKNICGLISARLQKPRDHIPENYEQWIRQTYGHGMAEHYLIPYSRKVWSWDLKDMNCKWIDGHVPQPRIREVLWGALSKQNKKYGPTQDFWYPIHGGSGALSDAFCKHIDSTRVHLNSEVSAVDTNLHLITLRNGRRIHYDKMITTMPLPHLVNQLAGNIPDAIKLCGAGLKSNFVHIVNVGIQGKLQGYGSSAQWLYFSADEQIFFRVSFPHNTSPWMVPEGCSSIQAEISGSSRVPRDSTDLIQETLKGLVRVKILSNEDIRPLSQGGRLRLAKTHVLKPAYPIYDHRHKENTDTLKQFLRTFGIVTAGRFGEWEYYNMGKTILQGMRAAKEVCGQ